MIVDISGNIFEIEPQKKKENNFINKILNIIPFQEVGNKYVAPLEWIYSFKALALKNKITDWDRKPGFVAWSNSLQKPAVEIECDINYSRIIWNIKNKKVEDEISKRCAYFVMGAVNTNLYKRGIWDGYNRLYSDKTKKFPTGLIYLVEDVLIHNNISYVKYNLYNPDPPREFNWRPNGKIVPEEDQELAVSIAYQRKRGVVKAPTGYGKTAIVSVNTVAAFAVPTLFIANKKTLLDDAKDAFIGLIDGLDPSKVHEIKNSLFGDIKLKKDTKQEDIPNLDSHIIVATIQSLASRLEDPRTKGKLTDWLQNKCKLFIVDECQSINDKQWKKVLDVCKAPCRLALSATPKRTDNSTLLIHSQTGDTIYNTTAEVQIEKGRLCELDIQYKIFDHKLFNEYDRDIVYAEAYKEWIVNNEKRNKFVIDEVLNLVNEDRLTLLLINFIEHGKILYNELLKSGLTKDDVRFVYGETKDKVRQAAISEFRKGAFKVLIGSTIFDAGVNIPAISGVVIAGAGNSEITLIQKIGRGARTVDFEKELGYIPEFMKGKDKKITKVVDIMDKNVKFFSKQASNRYANASEEFGSSRVYVVGEASKKQKVKKQKNITSEEALDKQIELMNKFTSSSKSKKALDNNLSDSQINLINMFIDED